MVKAELSSSEINDSNNLPSAFLLKSLASSLRIAQEIIDGLVLCKQYPLIVTRRQIVVHRPLDQKDIAETDRFHCCCARM